MTDSAAEGAINYRDLIKEVYIDPIRTVVVIDDEFPSLDGLIAKELGEEEPWAGKKEDVENVKQILDFCRGKDKPWLVDVHDGRKVTAGKDESIAPYLHHSDLVILDYHLEGNESGDKALRILRKLAENDHFNMVVVYTKGYPGAGNEIDRVVIEIALGLSAHDQSLELSDAESRDIIQGLGEWENSNENILKELQSLITEQTYLILPFPRRDNCKEALGWPELKPFMELFEQKPKEVKINPQSLFLWLLSEKEKEISGKLSQVSLGTVSVSPLGGSVNWVRTDRLFVSVVSKSHQPKELPDKLLTALDEWLPRPHRLLLAKMRSLIDERGVIAEAKILGNKYVQAGWLLDLLNTQQKDRMGAINTTINRHWEALGGALTTDISGFGEKLIKYFESKDREEIIKLHCPVNNPSAENNLISKNLNCYLCTKPIEGYHLVTGHILEISTPEEKKEYWICLSPACDLVPDQRTTGWFGRLGDYMPFIAVSLSEVSLKTALSEVNKNIFLFLEINEEIHAYTFNPNGDLKSNPAWEQMFAHNKGILSGNGRELVIGRLCKNESSLHMIDMNAKIVSLLRYEYALNLLQRLGGALSRVGLDFKNSLQE